MAETTTLNTIIQLRQGTTTEWESSKLILKKGEMGLEYLEDGKGTVKIKAGDGIHPFFDQEIDGIQMTGLPYVGFDVKDAQVFQSEVLDSTNEDDDVDDIIADLVTGVELQSGDMAIVKRAIDTDKTKVSYTSYVYEEGEWQAMDGNYSANNVYFKEDITLAGNYTAVGNVTKSSASATGNLPAKGKSLSELMQSIFTKEQTPTIKETPSAEITASGGTGEVGTTFSAPTATLKIKSVGSYDLAGTTVASGVVFSAGNVKLAEGADPENSTNTTTNTSNMTKDSKITLTASTGGTYADTAKGYTFSGSATHSDGNIPKTNLNNNYPASQIKSADITIADKSISFTGFRYIFAGGTKATDVNSAAIRLLTKMKKSSDSVPGTGSLTDSGRYQFIAKEKDTKIVIAYPKTWTNKTPTFQILTTKWSDTTGFISSEVEVADASGTGNYKTYTVYTYTPATPFQAETKYCIYFK